MPKFNKLSELDSLDPWLEYVEPYEGESISHYFGRLRRKEANSISAPTTLSEVAGIGPALSRWEKFRFNPFPSQQELAAVGRVVRLDVEQLQAMLPAKGEHLVMRSMRLCGACYRDSPHHRIHWQYESVEGCEEHRLRLISRCPACDQKLALPVEWVEGACKRCGMKFESMAKRQKRY
ncbi:hypothetical protein C7293_05545 [filamentous cyanobacterium CCT1]|nr:hypothetical protein C7293_05545 [filamentous cyanobacterium CCT1]PSN81037.1 hypothetical protein C8B47_03465 [filamentous cyanobacterium CCP4]